MKTRLSGLDRLNIPMILEKASIEGSQSEMITLKALKKDLIEKVEIDQAGMAHYNIRPAPVGGGIIWNAAKMAEQRDYNLTAPEIALLKQARETLDNGHKITEQLLDTCIKIAGMKLPEEKTEDKPGDK